MSKTIKKKPNLPPKKIAVSNKNIVKEKFKLASTNSETDIKNINRRKSKLNPMKTNFYLLIILQ